MLYEKSNPLFVTNARKLLTDYERTDNERKEFAFLAKPPYSYGGNRDKKMTTDSAVIKDTKKQIQKHLAEDTVLSNAKLYEIANNGVPISALEQFNEDISMMVASKVLPRKTLEDAINKPEGTLSARNSEKLIRVLRLKHKAKEALGEESAIRWMEKPNKNFNGLCAIEMAKSESGARAVEQFLGQLAHGFNA